MKRFAVFALSALAAAAVYAAPKNQPDWLDGSNAQYRREQYIIGVGMADDLPTAEERARAEVTKVFSAKITSVSNVSESESTLQQGKKTETSFSQKVSQDIQSVTSKVMQGVEIAEHWQNPETRQHYALAIVERAKAAATYREKIADLDTQIKQWRADFDAATDKFGKVKAALKLNMLLKGRDALNDDLRVVEMTGKGAGDGDSAAFRPQLMKAIAALVIYVDVQGEGSDRVETGVIRALTDLNMQATKKAEDKDNADILVTGDVETNEMKTERAGPWKFARITATISLRDPKTGNTFLRLEESQKGSSSDYNEAVRRGLVDLGKKLSDKIRAGIEDYFGNQ